MLHGGVVRSRSTQHSRGCSPARVKRSQLVPLVLLRKNLSYYDYNQIKWAKVVHYLLENYRTAANIRTKDVLLCSKERELLRSYHLHTQAASKLAELVIQPRATPLLFIDSHCLLLRQRKRQHRQLAQAKAQRQLNPKNSQKSLPMMLCPTNTHQDQERQGSGNDTRQSRVLNFDALIGSSRDFTRGSERIIGPIRHRLAYNEETKRQGSPERRGSAVRKKSSAKRSIVQQRQNTKLSENPYLLEPMGQKPRRQKKQPRQKKISLYCKSQKSIGSSNPSEIQQYAWGVKKQAAPTQPTNEEKLRYGHRYTRSEGRHK